MLESCRTESSLLPTHKRGEVSPSYGDGGVMDQHMKRDPSVRCADTSPRVAWGGEEPRSGKKTPR
jgi:hypothetical protein